MGSDWAQLPGDLLIDIAKRIKCVEDMTSFSGVCTTWRGVTTAVKPKWSSAMPSIMIPKSSADDPSGKWNVFDLYANKRCMLDLPETLGWRYAGCVDGWMFIVDPSMDAHLFNPLTKAHFPLPSLIAYPEELDGDCFFDVKDLGVWEKMSSNRHIIIVEIPQKNEHLVVMVVEPYWLVYAKLGDSTWSHLECHYLQEGRFVNVEDVMFFNGQILLLYGDRKLVGFDVDLFLTKEKALKYEESVELVPGYQMGHRFTHWYAVYMKMYMIEFGGEVLLLLRHTKKDYVRQVEVLEPHCRQIEFPTFLFEVRKLDLQAKTWVLVEDLGDVMFFVDNYSATIVCASSADAKYKPNSVYFVEKEPNTSNDEWFGIGVFNMETGRVEVLDQGFDDVHSVFDSPFWFMPKFNCVANGICM